jgi:hypothetical protein
MRINDDEFIDGSNAALSGIARYMNHAKAKANVAKFISQAPVCEWLCVCVCVWYVVSWSGVRNSCSIVCN